MQTLLVTGGAGFIGSCYVLNGAPLAIRHQFGQVDLFGKS